MKTKNKKGLKIITITIAFVALAAVICSIALVFAAETQNAYTGITIYYESVNINATVSGQYSIAGGSATSLGSAKIDPSSEAATLTSLSASKDISLDIDNTYAEFKFTFKNDSNQNNINIALNDGAKKQNVTTKYAYSQTDASVPSYQTTFAPSSNGIVKLAIGETVYIYVYIEITNLADDALYESNDTNYLSWKLTAEEAEG